jgi:DnaJ-class molecular chaperone
MAKNYYDILGISRDATDEEIKKSYRRLAKRYHPDVNKGDKQAEERFKEISEAYEVISDKEKRKQYDMFGAYGPQGGQGFDPSQWAKQGGFRWETKAGPGGPGGFGFEDLSELFKKAGTGGRRTHTYTTGRSGDDLGDIFGDIFGVPQGGQEWARAKEEYAGPSKGRDLYYSMEIDFIEAVRGTTSKISIHRGGKIEKINVKIPAGVHHGSKIRLAGKGEPANGRGKPGDLYIEVKVKPHRFFWREGNDLFLEAPISVGEAALGGTIRVPTLEGSVDLKIPPGTHSGQKFRLKGKGVSNLETGQRGDLYVITNIVIPKQLDERSRQLIEEFEKLNPMNLRKDLAL